MAQLVGTVRPQEADQNQLIRMMVGRSLGEIFPRGGTPPGRDGPGGEGPRPRKASFSDVSFSLQRGEILGMFGLVGSGRTQVARCIFGAEPFDSGRDLARVASRSIRDHRARPWRQGIALLTEDRKRDGLVLICTIRDNASLASFAAVEPLGRHQPPARRRREVQTEDQGAGHSSAAARSAGPATERREPAEAGAGKVAAVAGQRC